MKGADIKAEIKRLGYTLTQVAEALGESQQNLNSALSNDNIKTGTLERVAAFLGKPVSYFYGEGNTATASGSGTAVAGVGNSVNDSLLIDEIAAQRRLTEQALAQNGQLLKIIDNLTRK